jgi:protein involved in polysaccharide export with SLBB domain
MKPYDRISVRRAPGYREPEEVSILGEVKFAGSYALNLKSMRISDLIVKAGGLTLEAYPAGAYFQRKNNVLGTEVVGIDLPQILSSANSKDDLYLMDGDVLVIPKRLQTVKVTGNILNPLSLTYEPSRSILYYVSKTGGFNENTRKSKIYIKYPNGTTATTSSFLGFKNYPEVKPGAEIIIPQKPEKERTDQTAKWLGIASTMSTLAIAISYLIK